VLGVTASSSGKWENEFAWLDSLKRCSALPAEGGLMLPTIGDRHNHRFARNPYFHLHQMHPTFALLVSIILFVLMAWFLFETR
jgi:hypothetical protein